MASSVRECRFSTLTRLHRSTKVGCNAPGCWEANERKKGESCTCEESGLRADNVPQGSGENARHKQRQPDQKIENAVSRPTQLGRSGVGNQGGEQSLYEPQYAVPISPHRQPLRRFHSLAREQGQQ